VVEEDQMTEDHVTEALHRLAARPARPRALTADAQTRIEARIDTAFTAESTRSEPDLVIPVRSDDLTFFVAPQSGENPVQHEPRRWIGVAAAVAVTILVVAGFLVLADRDDLFSQPSVADPVPSPKVTEPVVTPNVTNPIPTVAQAEPPPVTNPIPTVAQADPLPYQWSRVPHDEAVFGGARGQRMKSVTVGGPGLVAVGSVGNDVDADAAVWTSVDGLTWSRVAHDEAIFGGARGQWMNSVTVGGPGLVAVGSDGTFSDFDDVDAAGEGRQLGEEAGAAAVWTSVDGLTWSRVAHDEAIFGGAGDQQMNSVTAGGPGLVAVGNSVGNEDDTDAAVWTSVDGLIWSRVPPDEAVGEQEMHSVTAAGPGLVAVGSGGEVSCWRCPDHVDDPAVWTSVDGITWSRVARNETVFGRGQVMHSVTVGGLGLVAVGTVGGCNLGFDAVVWTSVDGLTWSAVPDDEAVFGGTGNQKMHSVTDTGAGLVAVGVYGGYDGACGQFTRPEAVVWTSLDGITWSRVAHDEAVFGGAGMNGVTVTGAGLVAVGDESLKPRGPAAQWDDSVFVWVAEPEL
jgi:hypothetical protein